MKSSEIKEDIKSLNILSEDDQKNPQSINSFNFTILYNMYY